MELLTITCERDLPDMLLQAHTINKFVDDLSVHRIAVEDGSKSYQEWVDILSPYYTKHNFELFWFKRPDLDYSSEFIQYPHRPDAKSGIGGLGWRRQQILKIQMTASLAESERVLVLDSKNIFVRPTSLASWPVKHGNDEYVSIETINTNPLLFTIKNWIEHLEKDHGLTPPKKFAKILETPFVWQTDIVEKMWNDYDIPALFMNPDVIPNSEFHMYFFFVDPKELEEPQARICRVLMWTNVEDYDKYILDATKHCDTINSPTHGLHRQTRQDMSPNSIEIYRKWLTDKGLDDKLVYNYLMWCR